VYEGVNVNVRFAVVYTLLAVVGAASIAAAVLLWFVVPPKAASKADLRTTAEKIRAQLGPTTEDGLVKEAQKAVAQAAAAQGVTLTNEKVLKVTHPDPLTVYVYIKATTAEYGPITLRVPFKKGIYALGALEQA